ncbi:MAG: DUF4349 domain-containing protein, partial [Actinomycetota bacterium]|nr:DUF4349 domain-containing protein [Actinomycetota bacterium]
LESLRPRRLLLPAGAAALLAIVVATAVVSTNQNEDDGMPAESIALLDQKPQPERGAGAPQATPPAAGEAAAAEDSAGPEESAGVQYEADVPTTASAESEANSGTQAYGAAASPPPSAKPRNRAVERSAELVLGAAPGDVGEDTSKVFEAVHAHDGIVMRSSSREGKAGGARFELLIPSDKLGDALAALSAIDEVLSRHEATTDITAPTVTTGELLRDSKARIDSLLAQLEEAETESEREVVEAELRQERRHRARLRASLQNLQRRADLSRVLVRIETGVKDTPSEGGSWGVTDALDDAGKILAVAAAVTVVALAILGPIALIVLLAWLTHRAWVRRERRRVLS